MSSLSIFPIEILEWITSVVSTSQQIRLWQCGDRILNIKLKNGGLKRTSLCWSAWTWMPWPRWYFTTFDGIVDVKWDVIIGKSLCPTLELHLLPKALKRLHLACEDVYVLLRQQNINMNDVLPSLQSLYLSGSRLRKENLKNLPSNLIELHVASRRSCISSCRIFGDLPRHIARLTLKFHVENPLELENELPNQLISLNIFDVKCDFDWFSKLPKSLKILKVSYLHFLPNWLSLPPELEELRLGPHGTVPKSVLLQLPQSLKTLVLSEVNGLTPVDELGHLLPKNLTRFALDEGGIFDTALDHSALQHLPASLTDFDAAVSATHPDILSFFRPETTKMRIIQGPFSGDKLNLFPFPIKLVSLELDQINDDICAMLPPGLQALKIINGGLMTTQGASKLPKSLTSFTAWLEIFADNQTMSYLRHTSNLVLSVGNGVPHGNLDEKPFFEALSKFTNLNTLRVSYLRDLSCDWLCWIPRKVTNLCIGYLTAYPSATQLSMLPKCLRYLKLTINTGKRGENQWNDEIIQSLPRSLQQFTINGAEPDFKSHLHEYLPPNLEVRYWEGCGMDSFVVSSEPLDRLYGEN